MRVAGMCIDWKVIAGLTVVAAGILVFFPNLFLAALPLLLVAICPLSMLLMMRNMSSMGSMGSMQGNQGNQGNQRNQGNSVRGMRGSGCAMAGRSDATQPTDAGQPFPAGVSRDEQIAYLRAELARTQARLKVLSQQKTAHRERMDVAVVREAEAVARAADEQAH
jgi:hypothetical protein